MTTIEYYTRNAAEYCMNVIGLNLTHLYEPFLACIPAGGRILDGGCGPGRDSLYFKGHGYAVTAFDACEAFVDYSSKLLEQPVLHLTFQQLTFTEEFDGVWACASLLHVPQQELDSVVSRLSSALKKGGILYASFKLGLGEKRAGGRLFSCLDESHFSELLIKHPSLSLRCYWRTQDVRDTRRGEVWLNALIVKVSDENSLLNF